MSQEHNAFSNLFREEWKYLGKDKKKFFFYTALFLIAGVITLMTPLVIGHIFNLVQNKITSTEELHTLTKWIVLLFFLTVGFWMFHGLGRYLEQMTGFLTQRNYVNAKIERVLELPVKWHKDHHSGDTIDKINNGSMTMTNFARHTTFEIYYALVNIVGSVIILLFFDIRAAVIATIFSMGTIYIIYRMDKKLNEQYKEINLLGNKAAAAVFDYISNVITVITLRLKKTVKKEIDARLMARYPLERKTVILNEIKWGFASLAISAMIVLTLVWRAWSDYYTSGMLMVGTLYILYGYLDNVGRTFHRFASLYGRVVKYNANIVNAYPIDEAYAQLETENKYELPSDWKTIKLENVAFTHDDAKKTYHIDNINFQFEKGKKIALIGASGSGKSTMLSLLRGLDRPEKGTVKINSRPDVAGFEKIKQSVTLIPQDPEIFNNTIKYNITMDLPVKSTDIERVMKLARFSEIVPRLPKGLQTNVLEKGVSLSGGEKQRLALARGLLAAQDSDILLMDEPTSSVDTLNEVAIYENIMKQFKQKTIISALHRLHLLKYFDYIYVFERGKIVAHGTLDQIKKTPEFNRAWKKYNES